ncbi:hypothetical protein [Gimesia sp.]|uniref:hypothetical protein n=1 Tax=Gimesia sp. TaxID=2024833 RepID=UPI0032EFE9C4
MERLILRFNCTAKCDSAFTIPPSLLCADRYDFWLRALVLVFSENQGAGRVWVGDVFLPETF